MREKELKVEALYVVLGIGGGVVFLCFLFLVASLRAELSYQRIRSSPPKFASERQDYYRNALVAAQQALSLQPDNARHYVRKADYLWGEIQNAGAHVNGYDAQVVEELYEKAVRLNPLNYAYHLQLGLFYYNQKDLQKAGKYLEAAHALYPQDYLSYFYLSKYYFQDKQPLPGFAYLLQAFHRRFRDKNLLFEQIVADVYKPLGLSFDVPHNVISYTFPVGAQQFDLKTQQFPHETIPVRLRVYVSVDGGGEPLLYCKQTLVGPLKRLDVAGEYRVYEAVIDSFLKRVYLDDFMIRVSPPARIEKVECVYNLYY